MPVKKKRSAATEDVIWLLLQKDTNLIGCYSLVNQRMEWFETGGELNKALISLTDLLRHYKPGKPSSTNVKPRTKRNAGSTRRTSVKKLTRERIPIARMKRVQKKVTKARGVALKKIHKKLAAKKRKTNKRQSPKTRKVAKRQKRTKAKHDGKEEPKIVVNRFKDYVSYII